MYHKQSRPVFRIVTSAGEAHEQLRVIRETMERSTRHSTLSGLSGVAVGLLALVGCWLDRQAQRGYTGREGEVAFIFVWAAVVVCAFAADYLLTKRRAARVGKTALSPLGRHLFRAAAPGFLAALVVSVYTFTHNTLEANTLYGVWMVCYAVSLLAVGMFSLREVSVLGWAFLAAGAVTLLLPAGSPVTPITMMAATFGGFHILYGVYLGARYGW